MIQLCFGDSVKGTLTCAPHIGNTIGGATAVVISTDKPLDTPLQKAAFAVYRTLAAPFYKRRAQKQEARRRAEVVPVDYESNDVIALLGDLNEGPIAGNLMSEARKEVVRAWLCFSPHGDTAGTDADVEPYWQACQKDLQTLLTRAHTGEPVRIWYDHTPASLSKMQLFAPRDNASMPSWPLPANRSSTRAPGTRNCTLENMASLTRLIVGRVTSSPGNACRFLPRAVPAITRMVMLPFSKSFCFTSFIMRPVRPNVKAEYVK